VTAPTATAPGLGIDLVSVARFRTSVEDGGQAFLDRVFTPEEQQDCLRRKHPHPSLAARFAAKEAVMKALGTGWSAGVRFRDIEVASDEAGVPRLRLHGRAAELADAADFGELRVSLSHTDEQATAVVVAFPG
jgi:holo-[acyl-carrier protein] synthase